MEVKEYIERYTTLDKPIPYKGLIISPILVEDFYDFSLGAHVLNIDKNAIPNIEIIKMSYLEFLMVLVIEDKEMRESFYKILELCFNKKRKNIKKDESPFYFDSTKKDADYCLFNEFDNIIYKITLEKEPFLIIDGKILDSRDFDYIVKIIMFQNFIDYDDTVMDKDFKEAIDEYYRIKNKGILAPDIEAKRDVLLLYKSIEEVNKLTYRRFQRLFSLIVDEKEYTISKQAELFGTKFEKSIEHWIYKKKKDKYADAFASADNFKNKLSSVTG